MANELMEMRVGQNIPAKDMVEVVQALYPRFDKPLLSKCQHHELYGIDLRKDAMKALRTKYTAVATNQTVEEDAAPIAAVSRDAHRLTCRVSCRLEDEEYQLLKQYVKADGYDTMQDWLVQTVRQYIKRRAKKDASNA